MARKKKKKKHDLKGPTEVEDVLGGTIPLPQPVQIGTQLQAALSGIAVPKKRGRPAGTGSAHKSSKKAPTPRMPPATQGVPAAQTGGAQRAYSYEDKVARRQAMAGVAPLRRKRSENKGGTGGESSVDRGRSVSPTAGVTSPVASTSSLESDGERRFLELTSRGAPFVVQEESDWIEGHRQGVGRNAVKDLKGGRARAEAELDLHGKREAEVAKLLVTFLRTERNRGARVVRVIHGKGLHSPGAPVLRDAVVEAILRGPAHMLVAALSTCARDFGGAGAMLLRIDSR